MVTAYRNRSGGSGGSLPRAGGRRIDHFERGGCPFDHAKSTVWGGTT